jgi:hypothetical protein
MNTPLPAAPRVRRSIRILAIAACVVLVPAVAYSVWDYVELHRLITEIEAIQAKGEPVSDRQTVRVYDRLPADQQRAGDYYVAAAALAQHTKANAPVRALRAWLTTVPAPRADSGRGSLAANVSDKVAHDVRAVADSSPEALGLADKAAALPFGGLPPGSDLGNRMVGLRGVGLLIAARTWAASLAGRGDEAVDSAITAIATRRPMTEMPWMPRDDFEIPAIFSLSTPSAAALRRLDAALAAAPPLAGPAQRLLAMRAEYLSQTWRRYYGSDPSAPQLYTLPMRSFEETLLRPIMSQRLVRSLQSWSAMIPPLNLTARGLQAMHMHATAKGRAAAVDHDLETAFVNARYYTESLTLDRSLRTLVAIERYRRDHGGTRPTSLAQLVPTYLSAVPLDPFVENAPLRYRADANATIVYGVGIDQQDDAGDLTPAMLRPGLPPEAGGAGYPSGRDIGLRVLMH